MLPLLLLLLMMMMKTHTPLTLIFAPKQVLLLVTLPLLLETLALALVTLVMLHSLHLLQKKNKKDWGVLAVSGLRMWFWRTAIGNCLLSVVFAAMRNFRMNASGGGRLSRLVL